MMPPRRRVAKSCSRNCTGTSRRRASSPIGTGPGPELRPSSASASTAYGDLLVIEIMFARRPPCRGPVIPIVVPAGNPGVLQPAALGGHQHGLGAIDRAELSVDVVKVRAHGARGQRQLVGD